MSSFHSFIYLITLRLQQHEEQIQYNVIFNNFGGSENKRVRFRC